MRGFAAFTILALVFMGSVSPASCLSQWEIQGETLRLFRPYFTSNVTLRTEIAWTGAPALVFRDVAVQHPAFARCGLVLRPNDLRFVRTIGEFAQVVNWSLGRL